MQARAASRAWPGRSRAQPVPLASGILPLARQLLAGAGRARLLDLGPPSGDKLAYLATVGDSIYFDNFPGSLCDRLDRADIPPAGARLPAAGPFDLILAWDYLSYLPGRALKTFLPALCRLCRPGTLFYFLIATTPEISARPAVVGVSQHDEVLFLPGSDTRPAYRHPPQVLKELAPGFEIRKLFLLKNGLQEHLFIFQP